MKKIIWDNFYKMHMESKWKAFNQQTNYIGTGNVYANTQMSRFIRPWSETECNHSTFPCGHLMDYDLSHFEQYRVPTRIRALLADPDRKESYILYAFLIRRKRKCERAKREAFAWVVTDYHNRLVTFMDVDWSEKHASARREAMKYIVEED